MGTAATRAFAPPSPWASVVRAMSQTGGASLLSSLLSMLATKIVAVTLGPAQVATLSTLQQLRQAAVVGCTLTGQTALVQGASATHGAERRNYVRTVLTMMGVATAAVTIAMLAAPGWIARASGLPAGEEQLVRWLALPVGLGAAYVFLAALLNATGAVGTLASVQLAAPASTALLAFPVARAVGAGDRVWFVVLLGASTGIAALAAFRALGKAGVRLRDWHQGGFWWNHAAARRFFAISGSMLASGAVASWSLLAVRSRILRTDGLAAGGEFDAAWAISMNQAGLVLASMQAYYLPALASGSAQERGAHIGRVLTVAALASAALIAALVALKPLVLSTLYSDEFAGAARYLRWTLPGDYLKISSWILSIPLVAAAKMRAFLLADLTAYGAFAAASLSLGQWLSPAESAAIGFVVMYGAHLAACGAFLWASGEFRPSGRICGVWLAGLAVVILSSALFWRQR